MRRVAVVLGTRPEAVKLAPVVLALEASPEYDPYVVVTGQHREILDPVLALFGIKPDVDLAILQHGQSLTEVTKRALTGLSGVFGAQSPDVVVVQGDTTTTLA